MGRSLLLCLALSQAAALAPAAIKPSDLTVRVEPVGRMPTTINPTSPAVAGTQLLLIDQGGFLYRWDGDQLATLFKPADAPKGLSLIGPEMIANAGADPAASTVFVVFTSSTLPAGIPRRTSPRPGADAWQVFYAYEFDGLALRNPRPITAVQVRTDGHSGGGLAVLRDGSLLFSTADNGDAGEDGRQYGQDVRNHLSKLLHVHTIDGSIDVVAIGIRNSQRLVIDGSGDDARLELIDIGGWISEELDSIPLTELLAPGTPPNFGWGRNPTDGKAREGTFYIDEAGRAIGVAPKTEPGYRQPVAEFGREGAQLVAGTGPLSSAISFHRIVSMFGDLVTGNVLAVTSPLATEGQDVWRVNLVDGDGHSTSLKTLAGDARPDPRFFNFADGGAGVLLEKTGVFYRLTELPQRSR